MCYIIDIMIRDKLQSDYDSLWKETLNIYLKQFTKLCYSEVYKDIDWSRGYESLDTKLQEIIRDAETGRRFADKLLKVWLHSGEETVVLIHIEVALM